MLINVMEILLMKDYICGPSTGLRSAGLLQGQYHMRMVQSERMEGKAPFFLVSIYKSLVYRLKLVSEPYGGPLTL